MKKRISLLIALVLVAAMLIPGASFIATAADAVSDNQISITTADNQTTEYRTLQKAIDAGVVTDGVTVNFLSDAAIISTFNIIGKDITVNGNGYTLSYVGTSGAVIFAAGGVKYADDDEKKATNLYVSASADVAATLEVGTVNINDLHIKTAMPGVIGINVGNATLLNLTKTYVSTGKALALSITKNCSTVNMISGAYTSQSLDGAVINLLGNNVANYYNVFTKIVLPDANKQTKNQGRCILVDGTATFNMYGGVMLSDTYVDCISPRNGNVTINMYGGTLINTYYDPRMNPSSAIYDPSATGELIPEAIRTGKTEHILYGSYTFVAVRKGIAVTDSGDFAVKETIKSYTGEGSVYVTYKYTVPHTTLGTIGDLKGAAIKFSESGAGLRFTSTISKDMIDYATSIMDEGSEIKYGTIIAPADYIGYRDWTLNPDFLDLQGLPYKDITANEGLTTNADGSVTYNASLVGIRAANANRDFAAVSYIEYTVNGQTVRNYSLYDGSTQKANLAQLAKECLADVNDTSVGDYLFGTSDGKYSPYTVEQQAILAVYASYAE